jgi:hypothetical protein
MIGTKTMERPCTTTPTIGGILSIVAGVFQILVFVILPAIFLSFSFGGSTWKILLLLAGILAILGGILAIKRQHWWLALTGVAFSVLPTMLLGIVAIVLVAKSKREFSS